MNISRLRARWAATTVLGLIVLGVMGVFESHIKHASGYGLMNLEASTTAALDSRIVGAWVQSGTAPMMGFVIGLDYLFMFTYGLAFFHSGLLVREAFAQAPGRGRRILTVLAFAPFLATAFDVLENAFEARMLFAGAATQQLACLASTATITKFVFFAIGIGLWLAGIAALASGRLKRT